MRCFAAFAIPDFNAGLFRPAVGPAVKVESDKVLSFESVFRWLFLRWLF
jgi:hypothetical protein